MDASTLSWQPSSRVFFNNQMYTMTTRSYFWTHVGEYLGDDYYRFKITDDGLYSFLILIHGMKTVVDLYEEVELRMHGSVGEGNFRLLTTRGDPGTELHFTARELRSVTDSNETEIGVHMQAGVPDSTVHELFIWHPE